MTLTDYFIHNVQLQKEWSYDRNTVSTDNLTPHTPTRVWWFCDKGHEWQASPDSRVSAGESCPYCLGRYSVQGQTDLATTHPHVLKIWSGRNKLSPARVTAGSHRKVLWECEKGHEWEAAIVSVVLDGSGCPYCAGKKAIPGETDLATLRPDLMKQWDFEKNTLNPGEITVASHDQVWWRCELGHTWQARVFSRTREQSAGCPYCTGRKVLAGFNDLATLKPEVAQQWYQPLNGELKPEEVTPGSNKKVWWRCGDGHVWSAAIYSRTRKRSAGCPVCAGAAKRQRKEESRGAKEKRLAGINN